MTVFIVGSLGAFICWTELFTLKQALNSVFSSLRMCMTPTTSFDCWLFDTDSMSTLSPRSILVRKSPFRSAPNCLYSSHEEFLISAYQPSLMMFKSSTLNRKTVKSCKRETQKSNCIAQLRQWMTLKQIARSIKVRLFKKNPWPILGPVSHTSV